MKVSILGLVDKGLRQCRNGKDQSCLSEFQSLVQWIKDLDSSKASPSRTTFAVSILGLVDKGLRQESQASATFPFAVSILGLVDKGLRQFVWKYILSHYYSVSILGLVDKGLRPSMPTFHRPAILTFQSLVQWIKDLDLGFCMGLSLSAEFQSLVQWIKDLDGLSPACRSTFVAVSILGLVDKGLRHTDKNAGVGSITSFNPWFSG